MYNESQLWRWGGNFFWGLSCRFIRHIPGSPSAIIIVVTAKITAVLKNLQRGDDYDDINIIKYNINIIKYSYYIYKFIYVKTIRYLSQEHETLHNHLSAIKYNIYYILLIIDY